MTIQSLPCSSEVQPVEPGLDSRRFEVLFGQKQTACISGKNGIELQVKIPVLGDAYRECIFSQPGQVYQQFEFHLIEADDYLVGAIAKEAEFPLEKITYEIYLDFLELTKGWNLHRVWHYVPFINHETDQLENYKSFCKARSLAFEAFYGERFDVELPAASAVGIDDNRLVIYFIVGKARGIHLENPEQVSAYKYPKQYGPRSPSFARGTILTREGKRIGYLSGTASIKSHESVTLPDITDQLHTTLDNMSLVFERMGLVHERHSYSGLIPDPARHDRMFKFYIRRAKDAHHLQSIFTKIIGATEEDQIIYLQSDICRSELDLEIEAIISER